jgi:formylglycine-generating enzyme required for sulfatase activity
MKRFCPWIKVFFTFVFFITAAIQDGPARGFEKRINLPPTKGAGPQSEWRYTKSLGMKFVYIPPGNFLMGSPGDEKGRDRDETQHQVILTKGFYIQTTEVTQGQWKAVMGNNPSYFKACGDDCPVEGVSWNDVRKFIRKLNQEEGIDMYRLPSEAEWEYACRAGTRTRFSWGDDVDCDTMMYENDVGSVENHCADSNRRRGLHADSTVPVKSYQANAWGLFDMHGNVWEWCQDCYGTYSSGPVTDPTGPSGSSFRVYRGGSWVSYARYCRAASRSYDVPDSKGNALGFRLARTP